MLNAIFWNQLKLTKMISLNHLNCTEDFNCIENKTSSETFFYSFITLSLIVVFGYLSNHLRYFLNFQWGNFNWSLYFNENDRMVNLYRIYYYISIGIRVISHKNMAPSHKINLKFSNTTFSHRVFFLFPEWEKYNFSKDKITQLLNV